MRWRLLWLLILEPFHLWGLLAFFYGSWPAPVCLSLALLYGVGHYVLLFRLPIRWIAPVCAAWWGLPLAAFFIMTPSNDRNWQPDVARTAWAERNGDRMTIHNVRNCDYISETNFVVRYEDRSYNLNDLQSVDILLSDWGLHTIVHTMISFGFGSNQYLCVSIETRKEQGETYSAFLGFFRQYELVYLVADERDVVRLRTNYRDGEEVYCYRAHVISAKRAQQHFLAYMDRINELREQAEWYNALTKNCMTSVFRLIRKHAAPGRGRWHWSMILNGYADRHAYDSGSIDTSLPFDELKQRSRINDRAREADAAPDFSDRIRDGLPGMDWILPARDPEDTP